MVDTVVATLWDSSQVDTVHAVTHVWVCRLHSFRRSSRALSKDGTVQGPQACMPLPRSQFRPTWLYAHGGVSMHASAQTSAQAARRRAQARERADERTRRRRMRRSHPPRNSGVAQGFSAWGDRAPHFPTRLPRDTVMRSDCQTLSFMRIAGVSRAGSNGIETHTALRSSANRGAVSGFVMMSETFSVPEMCLR